MFDVVDVAKCRSAVLARLEELSCRIRDGGISDATGGRMSAFTTDEAYGVARTIIGEEVDFVASNAPRYLAQFPEILTMELVGSTVSDSLSQGLLRAVFGRLETSVRQAVAEQFDGYGASDLDRAVSNGLIMFDRHLAGDRFAPLRVKPSKVSACLADITEDAGEREIVALARQMNIMVSEMKNKHADARHAARGLREASQFCMLVVSGEAGFRPLARPALSMAC